LSWSSPEEDFVDHFAADGDQAIPPDAHRQFALAWENDA
jgi:hypothetical protein